MYTYFRIQNFRGFKDLELKDIARVNLIGGKNNVGKTALLEAIAIHTGMYNPEILLRMDASQMRPGNSRIPRVEGLPSWNMIFSEFDTEKVITLSGNHADQSGQLNLFDDIENVAISKVAIDEISEDSRIINRIIRNEILDSAEDVDILEFKTNRHVPYYLMNYKGRIRTDSPPSHRIPGIFLLSREKVDPEANAKRFSNLQRNRQQEVILEVLRVVDQRIKRLELLYDGYPPLIYADIGLVEPVPFTIMGDGTNRILSLMLAMSAVQNGGIIFIDEIENGLHYSIQEDIWKAIETASKRFNVQVFATTHSLEMIRSAQQAFADTGEDDFRYYRIDRHPETDEPLAVRYAPSTIEAAVRMEYEVRG